MQGRRCKAYYLSTGTRASWGTLNETSGRHEASVAPADLTEIESVKEITLPSERATSTSSDRGSDWEVGDVGPMTGPVQMSLNHRKTDAGRDALQAAYILDTVIALAILDGDKATVGTEGLWADFKVAKFARNEPESGPVTYDVELIPYDLSDVDPEWVEVISGA
jgi:hypothetical protein